jgi:uncharacterized protein YbaP (TraB family)
MSADDQVRMVMDALREGENAQKKFEEMEQIYLDQDLDRLYCLTKDDSNYLNRSFLEDRNLDWIPKFTNMMKDKVVFIAVGAAHLAGPEGVIELLIKEGFQLTPIKL